MPWAKFAQGIIMKHLLITAPSFRVSTKNGKMRVSIPEVKFLLALGNEIRSLGPMILGSMASVSCAAHGVSTLRAACGKSDSFDAVEFAEVNFYGDGRGIVVLVDGVKAMKLIAQKHNLADGTPKAAPALYEHDSIIKNALNLLEKRFPGEADEPYDSLPGEPDESSGSLGAGLMDKQKELGVILRFAREENLGFEVCTHQLRSLWTAYCIHHDLEVDTSTYDADLRELWQAVSEENSDNPDWSDFESFDLFMCDDLV